MNLILSTGFNTTAYDFYHLVVAYFLGHPIYFVLLIFNHKIWLHVVRVRFRHAWA